MKLNESAIRLPRLSNRLKAFLKRSVVIFLVWTISYQYVLRPLQIPDRQLTSFTTKATVAVMSSFSSNKIKFIDHYNFATITVNERKVVRVHHACNALELYILYIGFLVSYGTNLKRVMLFAFFGSIVILMLNISRISILTEMSFRHSAYLSLSHKYIFKTIVYGVVLGMWYLYTKKDESA
jgi:exosortase family protein XrtF